jgi:hypothetical protein
MKVESFSCFKVFAPLYRDGLIIVFTVTNLLFGLFFGAVFMMIYFIHNACGDSRRFGLAPGEMAFRIGRTLKGYNKPR